MDRIDRTFFDLPYVEISAANTREVVEWKQPMLRELGARPFQGKKVTGVILLARKLADGVLQYLVQAKAEPGNSDRPGSVLLGPSIQASFSNVEAHPGKVPLWTALGVSDFIESKGTKKVVGIQTVEQGKDGGRFYQKNNLLVMRDVEADTKLDIPETHTWATREAIRKLQLMGLGNEHLAEVFGTFL